MLRLSRLNFVTVMIASLSMSASQSSAQEKSRAPAKKSQPALSPSSKDSSAKQATRKDATATKAAFEAKFNEYKNAIRDIEKTRAEFQAADSATRVKLNETMTAQVAHAKTLVDGMVEAGVAAYAAAPNTDPQITNLLSAVAKHYTIGRQIGPGQPSRGNPDDVYYPIDGGDQYERALPILKLLIEKQAPDKQL